MIEIDTRDVKQLESDLKTFARRAFPFATKATMNRAAFETQRRGRVNLREDMTLRNRYTEQSVRVEQTRTLIVRDQAAIVGSIADYLETQEFGGMVRGRGDSQPIATSYSAGQGRGARPRTRLPRAANKMRNIHLKNRRSAKTRKQRVVFAMQDAVNSGQKFVYLDLGRRKGIFRITGGKKGTRRGWPTGAKINMVWDLTRTAVRIPRRPWLLPATNATQRAMPQYYAEALRFQLRRHRVFGYR